MYGKVDRGGSREGKKSLRKNKIEIIKMQKTKTNKGSAEEVTKKKPAPALGSLVSNSTVDSKPIERRTSMIDSGAALANRRFESDMPKVISRALSEKVEAIIIHSNDYEKQESLQAIAKEYSSTVYFSVGIHPDNIKRTNDKLIAQKLVSLREVALNQPECVAILAGLDLSREVGTHYAQEKLLKELLQIASDLEMPAILYQIAAAEQMAEKLKEAPENLTRVALFNFNGNQKELDAYLALEIEVFFIITGTMCDPNSEHGKNVKAILPFIPLERILIASDSPFSTPQNIDDAFVKSGRNEPSNLSWIFSTLNEVLANSIEKDAKEVEMNPSDYILAMVRANSKSFFGLLDRDEVEEETKPNEAESKTEENVSSSSNDKQSVTKIEKNPKIENEKKPEKEEKQKDKKKSQKSSKSQKLEKLQLEDDEEEKRVVSQNTKKKKGRSNKNIKEDSPEPVRKSNAKKGQKIIPVVEESEDESEEQEAEISDEDEKVETTDSKENDEELEKKKVKYACKKCRKILFDEDDVAQHQTDQSFANKVSNREGKVEVDLCQMVFTKHVRWARLNTINEEADEEVGLEGGIPLEESGKLSCSGCDSKLGRWSVHQSINCTCGHLSPTPAYMVKKKVLDIIVPLDSLSGRYIEERLSDEEDQKERKKKKKRAGGTKKNKSNFSSFRNKDY